MLTPHTLESIWQVVFLAPQATEEELEASKKKKKKSKPAPSAKCTAAKAAANPKAAPGKRSTTVQPAEQEALPTPGNTPVKSPPKKKQSKKDKEETTGVARRLNFKSPDPDQTKQISTLQQAPVLLVISKVAVLAHELMILVTICFFIPLGMFLFTSILKHRPMRSFKPDWTLCRNSWIPRRSPHQIALPVLGVQLLCRKVGLRHLSPGPRMEVTLLLGLDQIMMMITRMMTNRSQTMSQVAVNRVSLPRVPWREG